MKIFRHLRITADASTLGRFRAAIDGLALPRDWTIDSATAKRVPQLDATVFRYTGDRAPNAHVWLTWDSASAEVSNILPVATDSLTHDEYNAIAESFRTAVVANAAAGLKVSIDLGAASESIDDLLNRAAADALRNFSQAANKATGASHPLDAERWQRFLILAHLDGAAERLTADTLMRWLTEDEEWSDDQAHELAIQYERAMDLLKQYDEERS